MPVASWIAAILLPPLVGAAANGALALALALEGDHKGDSAGKRTAGTVVSLLGVGLPLVSALCSWVLLAALLQLPVDQRRLGADFGTWFGIGQWQVHWSFLVDPLSITMALVVSTVGTLIHLYSVGYMGKDPGYARFFSYLNLFVFAMLVLVLARDLVLLFVGWEGVGLCSYLLIGFWFDDAAKAAAGLKAFVVNRVGDFGFVLGLLGLWWALGATGIASFSIDRLAATYHQLPNAAATVVCLLLLLGVVGKSAQIPLHVWLPDAMAGPTPVSALIHAATMVTAGVYLVARLSWLFEWSGPALLLVGAIGAVTACFAATVAAAQTNIKRVIAWSTISQLGYMFMALGVSAYSAGLFHLVTHAFFKGLFFLAAGAVIHALAGAEDLEDMGGLWPKLKWTGTAFSIAALANAGLFPLAGFVSKDAILAAALDGRWYFIVVLGWVTAALTAFYSVRLVLLVFGGPARNAELAGHAHEPPLVMGLPLALLTLGTVGLGALDWPRALGGGEWFSGFLGRSFVGSTARPEATGTALLAMGITLVMVLLGMGLAWWCYSGPRASLRAPSLAIESIWDAAGRGWLVDDLYRALVVAPLFRLSRGALTTIDALLDALFVNAAKIYAVTSATASKLQNGLVRSYGFAMMLGTLALVVAALWVGRWNR